MLLAIVAILLTWVWLPPAYAVEVERGWTVYATAERIDSHNYNANLAGVGVVTPSLPVLKSGINLEVAAGKAKGETPGASFTIFNPTGAHLFADGLPQPFSKDAVKFRASTAVSIGKGFFISPSAEFFKAGDLKNNSYQIRAGYSW